MKLVVGLGNPGLQYDRTRHNAGFEVIDRIATASGVTFQNDSKHHCQSVKLTLAGHSLVLAKPSTYMNLSGRAVQSLLHWYKLASEDGLLVIHDDVSLPLGRMRFQKGGGAGGQHGVESIIAELGGKKDFDRLKVGIGPDPGGDRRAQYVLGRFPLEDEELCRQVFNTAAEAVTGWIGADVLSVANKYNGIDLRHKPAAPPVTPEANIQGI